MTAKKQPKLRLTRSARAAEVARISFAARRYVIEMAITATVSASVLLCLFVARHYT